MSPRSSRRNQIVTSARHAFAEQGYEGTGLRQIADDVGLTTAAISYHFSGKDDLLEEVVRPYINAVERLIADAQGPRNILAGYASILTDFPDAARLVHRDIAVLDHTVVGIRLSHVHGLLRQTLTATDSPRDEILASAAIGSMARPLLNRDLKAGGFVDDLVEGALSVLDSANH